MDCDFSFIQDSKILQETYLFSLPPFFPFSLLFLFEVRYLAQAGLELEILLPQLPEF